jgi:predicted enzyme related to lactoylglutathione lyase
VRPTALSFVTEDGHCAYRELSERGAVFVSEPTTMGHGGTYAVFEGGSGNLLNLHQD